MFFIPTQDPTMRHSEKDSSSIISVFGDNLVPEIRIILNYTGTSSVSLQRVEILGSTFLRMHHTTYDEDRICDLLRDNDPRLERFEVKGPRILLCCPSFVEFLSAVRVNASVKTVSLRELTVQALSQEQLNELLQALSHIETLEALEVAIPHVNHDAKVTSDTLLQLFRRSSNLKTLFLWPFVTVDGQGAIDALSEAVLQCSKMKQLALLNILLTDDDENLSFDPLLASLSNLPELDVLQIAAGLQANARCPIGETALANLVRSSSLNGLAVRNLGLNDRHCAILAEFLEQSSSDSEPETRPLQVLDLRFNAISGDGYHVLRQALENNFSLHWLETDLANKEMQLEIDFLLLLNRAGRFTYLKDPTATRREKIDVFSRTEDSLDAIYFLLTRNPTICGVPDASAS